MINELIKGIIIVLATIGLITCIRILTDWIVNKLG